MFIEWLLSLKRKKDVQIKYYYVRYMGHISQTEKYLPTYFFRPFYLTIMI